MRLTDRANVASLRVSQWLELGGGKPRLPVVEGSLLVQQEVTERARMETAVKPDPAWAHRDVYGHVHRWSGRKLPTLDRRSRHVPCDGSCGGVCEGEGYHVSYYVCRQCGVEVEPGTVPDELARGPGIPVTGQNTVSFRVVDTGGVLLPTAGGYATITPHDRAYRDAVLVEEVYDGDEPPEQGRLNLPYLVVDELVTRPNDALEVAVSSVEYVNLLPPRDPDDGA